MMIHFHVIVQGEHLTFLLLTACGSPHYIGGRQGDKAKEYFRGMSKPSLPIVLFLFSKIKKSDVSYWMIIKLSTFF